MYPLNVSLPAPTIGFACANNEAEHAALSGLGYLPALAVESDNDPSREQLEAEAAELGLAVDKRWGDKRLAEEIAKAK